MTSISAIDGKIEVKADFNHKEICRSIMGGVWKASKQVWVYPMTAVLWVAEAFKGADLEVDIQVRNCAERYRKTEEQLNTIKRGECATDHKFLMKHQMQCVRIAELYDRFSFFAEVGVGKTLISLEIIKRKAVKFLVICPKTLTKSAWVEDQMKFYPELKLIPISKNMSKTDYIETATQWGINYDRKLSKEKLRDLLASLADVVVINPESFKGEVSYLNELAFEGVIFDESTIIKNAQSDITKQVTRFVADKKYVYILSGKPNPNGLFDYFSQMRIIDTAVLGDSFFRFREQYFTPHGFMGYEWKPNPDAEKQIARRIATRSIVIKQADCLDLPEKTYIKRMVELNPTIRKQYVEMEKYQVLALQDSVLSTPNKMAALMKLRQITSGFIMNEGAVLSLEGKDKLNELDDILEEIGDKPVIIWAQFKEEIRAIEAMLLAKKKTVVTAYSDTKNVDESIRQFKYNEVQYIVANPCSLKFGVTFVNCTYVVYYSQDYNYENSHQSEARNYRKGQTKPCTYLYILADKTIDEDIYNTLQYKGNASMVMEKLIQRNSK